MRSVDHVHELTDALEKLKDAAYTFTLYALSLRGELGKRTAEEIARRIGGAEVNLNRALCIIEGRPDPVRAHEKKRYYNGNEDVDSLAKMVPQSP